MKTRWLALLLLAVAAHSGCANVFTTPRDNLERRLVYRPDKIDRSRFAPHSQVEWVVFSVYDPVASEAQHAQATRVEKARKRTEKIENSLFVKALASVGESMVDGFFDSMFESTVEGAVHLAVDAAFDLDHDSHADKRGVDGPADIARMEAKHEKSKERDEDERLERERKAEEAEADRQEAEAMRLIAEERLRDGVHWQLHGAFAPAPVPDQRRAVVLYCHGSKGNVEDCVPRLLKMAKHFNVSMLAFDYRGFGRSEGSPTERGILDDARAARLWLARREKVTEDSIVLMGSAFGSAVAVDLAAKDGCRGLVLENAFTSLGDAADAQSGWFKPSRVMKTQLDSESKIKHYHGPLLQCHGGANSVVPVENGRKLFDAAPGLKHFIVMDGGKHESAPNHEYKAALGDFFSALPPERSSESLPFPPPHWPAATDAGESSSRP